MLPTAGAARYTAGLSVARFLKPLTFQRIDSDAATGAIGEAVVAISATESLPGHGATAAKRLDRKELASMIRLGALAGVLACLALVACGDDGGSSTAAAVAVAARI